MRFLKDNINRDRGASMVEYGLLVAVIALVALSAVTLLGDKTDETFTTIAGSLEDDGSASAPGNSDNESGDQNGDDQNGGDQNGGDQNGGDQNGGDQNGGDQNGGDQNGQQGENDDDEGANGGSIDDANGGDQDQEEEEETKPGPPSNPTGSTANLTWWNGNKNDGNGAWQASVGYENDTNRHQYLQLEVTRVDEKGVTTKTTINGFYVPANGTSTFSHWDNQFSASRGKLKGVVEVQVRVLGITTSDQNWQPFSYPVTDQPVSVAPPTLK
jgi:Flp pilus assembly pilin Flp